LVDCKCSPGYVGTSDGVACEPCGAGGYKVASGVGECEACPAGTRAPQGAGELIDCKCKSG